MTAREGARKIGKAEVVGMAPSVNKTPVGSATPPIPYGVSMKLSISSAVSPNVFYTKCPAFTIISNTSKVVGDEAGVATGVKSGTTSAKAEPITKSSTVRVNGNWAIRHDDLFFMNEKNTLGKLVYPGGGSAPSTSGAGLPADSVPSDSLSLFSKRGLLNKLTDMGKQVAMSAVMGGDPMATLKSMVDPRNIIKNQLQQSLGGLMQSAGPIGSLIGKQVLNDKVLSDIVAGRNPMQSLKSSLSPENIVRVQGGALLQQAGPIASFLGQQAMKSALDNNAPQQGSPQAPPKNPLSSPKMTATLLAQANISPAELGDLLSKGAASIAAPKLNKMHLPSAYANSMSDELKNTKDTTNKQQAAKKPNDSTTSDEQAQSDLLFNIANTLSELAKQPHIAPPTNWQGLFK